MQVWPIIYFQATPLFHFIGSLLKKTKKKTCTCKFFLFAFKMKKEKFLNNNLKNDYINSAHRTHERRNGYFFFFFNSRLPFKFHFSIFFDQIEGQ